MIQNNTKIPITLSPGRSRNRLVPKIVEKDWDYVIDRTVLCPGEVSEWIEVNLYGTTERLLPLHIACCLCPPTNVIDALLKADFETVSLQDANGRLPLHMACDVERSSIGVVKKLLHAYPKGAHVKEMRFGFLPLHAACCKGKQRVNENVNKEDRNSDLQHEIVKELVRVHPNGIKEKDNKGWSPLAVACRTGVTLQVIQTLLNEYPNAAKDVDPEMRMPIHLALCARQNQDETIHIAKILLDANPRSLMRQERQFGFLPLHVACTFSGISPNVELIQMLIKEYPKACQVSDARGSLPLHLACRAGAPTSIIQQLIINYSRGARHKDGENRLPLHWACHLNLSKNIISILLDAYPMGVQQAERKYKFLPLHVACLRGASDTLIKTLLDAFPEAASIQDINGCLPLHVACKSSGGISKEAAKTLINAYPKALHETDYMDRTPLTLAKETKKRNNKLDMIEILNEISSNPRLNSMMDANFPYTLTTNQHTGRKEISNDLAYLTSSR